jgi:hypothetical protein
MVVNRNVKGSEEEAVGSGPDLERVDRSAGVQVVAGSGQEVAVDRQDVCQLLDLPVRHRGHEFRLLRVGRKAR